MSALDALNRQYGIRHFADGGTTADPIAGLYQSVLGRDTPDAAGLQYWQGQLASGQSLGDITAAFQNSPEAQARAAATPSGGNVTVQSAGSQYDNAQPITPNYGAVNQQTAGLDAVQPAIQPTYGSTTALENWYQTNLGRAADPEGLNFWGRSFGETLDPNEITQLQQSPEYTNRQAISNYYTTELGRAPDTSGLNFWSNAANTGTSLADIEKGIAGSTEGRNYDVGQFYQTELGRAPDEPGLKFWQDAAASGQSLADIQKAFNESQEGTKYDVKNLYKDVIGRAPDEADLRSWFEAIDKGIPREEILKSFQQTPEYQVAADYQKYLGRLPDAGGAATWTAALQSGKTPEEVAHQIALSEESINFNAPNVKAVLEATLGKSVVDSMTPEQIANYTRTYLDPTLTQKDTSRLQFDPNYNGFDSAYYLAQNPDVAADRYYGQNPYQHYLQYGKNEGRLSSDSSKANNELFDAQYYASNNPDVVNAFGSSPQALYDHYKQYGFSEGRKGNAADEINLAMSDDDKLKAVYTQIALDPVLGAKLKAENPMMWEKLTPLAYRPEDGTRNERTVYGQYGTVDVGGVKVPILNGQRVDQMFGDADSGTIGDFSHGRGNLTANLGWSSNSFSGKLSKGVDAFGVTKTESEYGTDYSGLNEAADLLKIDKSQFKDKQVQDVTKTEYDENGYITQQGGLPAFTTDYYGNQVPVMKTITAQDQLYDAVGKAAKDYYLYTGDGLTAGQTGEGGAKSFDTVLYKREGDELIPITKPVSHGGYQNLDVYTGGSGFNFGRDIAPGLVFVGTAALAMVTAGAALAGTVGPATAIGGAALGAGASTTAATIAGGVIIGATMGGLNASASGGDVGKGALTGAVVGGITSAMQPLMSAGPMAGATEAISNASGGFYTTGQVASIVSTTLATTLGSAVNGANGDQILKTFATSLASNGLSQGAVSAVTKALQDSGMTPDTLAKIARATQIAGSTIATSALTGKNSEQIMNNLISQFTDPSKLASNIASVGGAKDNTSNVTPRDPVSTGLTTGAVDEALIRPVIEQNAIDLANASRDAIDTLNSVKNWTGDAKDNLVQATGEMINQGLSAADISQNLQDFYKIPEAEATEYAKYMVDQSKQLVGPARPVVTVAQPTAPVSAAQPVTREDIVRDREALRNVQRTAPVAIPTTESVTATPRTTGVTRGVENLISGATASQPAQGFVGAALPLAAAMSPELAAAYAASTAAATMPRTEINKDIGDLYVGGMPITPPGTGVPGRARSEDYSPSPGKPITESYGGVPFSPANHVAPPTPFLGEAAEAPSGFADVPVLPGATPAGEQSGEAANAPAMWDPTAVPGQDSVFTPSGMGTVAVPSGAPAPEKLPIPAIVPGVEPGVAPETQPAVQPGVNPAEEPGTKPDTEIEVAPKVSPQVEEAIQAVARTQAEAQALEQAVPMVIDLVQVQAVPRAIAIPRVAVQVGVSVAVLTPVIDVALPPTITPETPVTPEIPEVTPTPTPAPTPKTPTPKAPTTPQSVPFMRAAKKSAEEETGIYDLGPAFTKAKTNYQLAGQFGMATGGAVATSQYDPFGLSSNYTSANSGIAGGDAIFDPKSPFVGSDLKMPKLTVGTTRKKLDYDLAGYPGLGKSNIGYAEGGEVGHNPQFFSEGGLGTLENRYVTGEGDGTSDSVPAMLANGEFVIPADVVAKLGNGSNEAGAGVLDQFLAVIREHAQKHNPKDLPPDSKGPLAYLLDAKKRA